MPFLALWRPDPRDGSRFDRLVLVVELLPGRSTPSFPAGARVRLWRSSVGRFTRAAVVVRTGGLVVALDPRDQRVPRARAALDAEGVRVAS